MFRVGSGGLVRTTDDSCERLKSLIGRSLEQNNLETAEFLAELLCTEVQRLESAERESVEAAYLYGLVLYLKGDLKSSQAVVRLYRAENLLCAYVLARCALKLDRSAWDEAARCLELLLDTHSFQKAESYYGMPEEATTYTILGQLYFKMGKVKESCVAHSHALDLDPYMWESFRALCDMRANVKVGKLYKNSQDSSRVSQSHNKNRKSLVVKPHTPFKIPGFESKRRTHNNQPPNVKQRLGVSTNSLLKPINGAGVTTPHSSLPKSKLLTTPPSKFSIHDKSVTPDHKEAGINLSGPNSGTGHSSAFTSGLDAIFYALAKSYKSASRYDCYKAVRILSDELPRHILTGMPWVLANLGKLHFELVNYEMSKKYFQALRELQPSRISDMEIYSTLLWHLNDSTGLSHLCHELLEVDRLAPETWCCIGNLFSLQKDHEESTKAFQRSTQLNPMFTYAYTLQGHEYSSNDAFDTAMTCYRKAIASNPHHYNAFYGLGMCCLKLGQYEECFLHFEKARSINPVNVILICCCGVALEKLAHQEKALQYYDLACELQPMSSLALFKRAQLLLVLGKYNFALESFEKLVTIAPDEATIHFLLGQLYQIVGRKQDAIKELTVAMNLDPKGSQLIQTALEKCHLMD
ncbi:LANO_0F11804g1_1 [Lachancea nothofagi CBS 11611]|uniref:LANO_0F11804g1_1 n=1 Tax=Lachancea nothofagi CBS 11611 TaxID=1266666 RepID=A0A1G4KB10_9SACH|nr:LANO_0F11804g1_1 [Lachancea nothofagi CBS 11611]